MKHLLFYLTLFLGTNSLFAQLPTEFITQITWIESKEVSYEMVDSSSIDCLTLGELAEYHGYEQQSRETVVVDLSGHVLYEKNILYEWNVHDDWIEGFSRILIDKDSMKVYDSNNQLFHSMERTYDLGMDTLTMEEAANYMVYSFDQTYFTQLQDSLTLHEIPYNVENGVLTALDTQISNVYDHNTKVMMTTIYDSFLFKTDEKAVEFELSDDGSTYAPVQETRIKWFLSKNGCCVRKTTVITRKGYYRLVNEVYLEQAAPFERDYTDHAKADYEIMSIANSDQFIVKSQTHKGEQIAIVIYDLAGKQLFNGSVMEGEAVRFPVSARQGMYLVHVRDSANRTVIGRILILNSSNQF